MRATWKESELGAVCSRKGGTSVSPTSWGLSSARLAQHPSSRARHPFLVTPRPGRAKGSGWLPRALAIPGLGLLLLLSSTQCPSWCLSGLVEAGTFLPTWLSPNMAKGLRLSRALQTGWRLAEARGCFRSSCREPKIRLTRGKGKQSLRTSRAEEEPSRCTF